MSDEFGERTQPPTERRRREARARGEVALSYDLVAAGVLLASMTGLWWCGPVISHELAALLRLGLSSPTYSSISIVDVQELAHLFVGRLAICVLPLLLIAVAAASVTTLVQTGFLWTPSRLSPQLDRLDPTRRLAQFLSGSSWIAPVKMIVKMAVLTSALIGFIYGRISQFQTLATGEPTELIALGATSLGELGMLLAFTLLCMALIDYGIQYWRNEQRLKMTVEEVRREHREDEVDPRLKRARRDRTGHHSRVPTEAPQSRNVRETPSIESVRSL